MNRTQIIGYAITCVFLLSQNVWCGQSQKDDLQLNDDISETGKDNLQLNDRISEMTDENIFRTDGYYNWGSSIYKDDQGVYHLFYSRWKYKLNFTGWLTDSEIARATSKNPSGHGRTKKLFLKEEEMGTGMP